MIKPQKEELDTQSGAEKLFNFRPLFFAAVFLCLGILFFYFYRFHSLSSLCFLALLPIMAFPFLFCRSAEAVWKTALAVTLCGSFFFAGGFLFNRQMDGFVSGGEYHSETIVRGKVVKIFEYDSKIVLYLTDVRIGKNQEKGQLIAYMPASFSGKCQLSDVVMISGKVKNDDEYFNNFGFKAAHISEDVRFICYGEDMVKTGESFDLFLTVRKRVQTVLYAGMDETTTSVVRGILLGDTTGMEEELYTNVRRGGIAHIFAVSGLHVGALFGFCTLMLNTRKKINKPIRFLIVAVVLGFYAGVCGYSASVLRATLICLISYASTLLNLHSDFLESLGTVAIVILLSDPVVLFEVGFQLSFAACLGISLLSAPFRNFFNGFCEKIGYSLKNLTKTQREMLESGDTLPIGVGERLRHSFVSFFSLSLSAQIFTAPILLLKFSHLSGWALLLNCIFVPFISAIFAFLFLFIVVACCVPLIFSKILLFLPNVVLSKALLLFESVDFSSFSLSGVKLSLFSVLCYYVAALFCSDKFNFGKRGKAVVVLLCLSAFTLSMVAMNA